MNRENLITTKVAGATTPEQPQKFSFPIIEQSKPIYFGDNPILQEGTISHYIKEQIGYKEPEERNCYALSKHVGGLNYIFSLNQYYDSGQYILSFKTEEYEFARTSLDNNTRDELLQVMSSFIETVHDKIPNEMDTIIVNPADAPYTKQEIENCLDAIIASPKNDLTREEIAERYKGFEVFDLYQELFNKDFLPIHYNSNSKAKARSRLFKTMLRKHLINWDIKEDYPSSIRFSLKRKT